MASTERMLIDIAKKQQAEISEHKALIGVLVAMLEKEGVLESEKIDKWLLRLRETWPDQWMVDHAPFEWLLNRIRPGDDPSASGLPDWLQKAIDRGRDGEDPDQSTQ